MTREERIAREIERLDRLNEEDEARIQALAIHADLLLAAAQRLREIQRLRGAIIDLLRAEGLPAMRPIQRMLPAASERGKNAAESASVRRAG